jgi:hypothetical protein
MHIQVHINEEGALRNQRHAFTDRFTLISELLQNARRAGATCIEVHYHSAVQILCVSDNGGGIDDFQKLLSFHESGWDADTCAQERPFGIGFSKCLYAASRCVITSGHQRVDIDTASALARASFEVVRTNPGDSIIGTQVELHGVDLPDLASRIETLCLGFPVPVLFNGQPLQRHLAEDHLVTVDSAMGKVYLTGTHDGLHNHHTVVFLQGFCVMRPIHISPDQVNVVHLDSTQFMARLPDRDKLIDEDVQRKRIDTELKACWRLVLETAKAQMTSERFVELFYEAMRSWGHLDLLNDLDVLPRELCNQISAYPIQRHSSAIDYVQRVEVAIKRLAVESGLVTLVALDWLSDDNAAFWMLAQAQGHLLIDTFGLDAGHWAQGHLRFLEEEPLTVQTVAEQHRTELQGRWIWPTVILCEAIKLQVGNECVVITDDGLFHEGCLYIPRGEHSGEPVRQASDFMNEYDQFMESDLEADRDALADLIRHLRSVDPVQTLDSMLQELRLGKYPLLRGKCFQLTVGTGPEPGHSLELID